MVCNFGLGVGIFGLRGTIHYKNFNKLIQKNYLAVVSAAFLTNIKNCTETDNFFSAMYKIHYCSKYIRLDYTLDQHF